MSNVLRMKPHPAFAHIRIDPDLLQKILAALCHPAWLTDYQIALTEAATRHMLVLAVFSGYSWCSHCQALKQEVFETCQFGFWGVNHGLVLLDIDVPAKPAPIPAQISALLQQYQVQGYPTVIGLNADSSERGRVVGYSKGMGTTAWINWFESQAKLNASPATP